MITIWVVDDDAVHADQAGQSILSIGKQKLGDSYTRLMRLYWDRTIRWEPTLRFMDPGKTPAPVDAFRQPPDIVVLDLFNEQGFVGEAFLRSLRSWEMSRTASSRAWVILWSVKSGLKEVEAFYREEPRRDRRVVGLETKSLVVLSDKIARCWQSWEEEQQP